MVEPLDDGIDIRQDDVSDHYIVALLEEHRQEMFKYSPPESVHALDLEGMRASEVTFWSAWINGEFAGCGALKQLNSTHAELKSMKTASGHLRKGVAARLLEHMLDIATQRNYQKVSLETGTMEAFQPARALYAKYGFIECPPFASYVDDLHSTFMSKSL